MEFREITAQEFIENVKTSEQFTFHQTPNWAEVKKATGWISYFVGCFDGNKCKAAAMILGKRIPGIGKYIFYSPRGYIVDYCDKELLTYFTNEIKRFSKSKGAILVKIDPYLPYKQRNSLGELVEGGFDNSKAVDNLLALGYKHKGFNLYMENLQPRWIMVMDLKDKTYEDVEKGYMATLRKELRQAQRNGIYTVEMKKEDLADFVRLANMTGERRSFETRPLSYYEQMWDALYKDGYMKGFVTKMNFTNAIEANQKQIDDLLAARKENEEKAAAGLIKVSEKKKQAREKEENNWIASYTKNIEKFTSLKKQYGEEVIATALICMESPNELISLNIGNNGDFMRFNTSFSAYDAAIRYCLERKYPKFNFYGITGDFNKDNPHYGLYEMKQRFGADVTELIGEFDLIVSPLWYMAYQTAMAVRRKIRRH